MNTTPVSPNQAPNMSGNDIPNRVRNLMQKAIALQILNKEPTKGFHIEINRKGELHGNNKLKNARAQVQINGLKVNYFNDDDQRLLEKYNGKTFHLIPDATVLKAIRQKINSLQYINLREKPNSRVRLLDEKGESGSSNYEKEMDKRFFNKLKNLKANSQGVFRLDQVKKFFVIVDRQVRRTSDLGYALGSRNLTNKIRAKNVPRRFQRALERYTTFSNRKAINKSPVPPRRAKSGPAVTHLSSHHGPGTGELTGYVLNKNIFNESNDFFKKVTKSGEKTSTRKLEYGKPKGVLSVFSKCLGQCVHT